MTRKDTILIAVVINAGLLAILFTTAVIYDNDKGIESTEFVNTFVDNKVGSQTESPLVAVVTGDEVDNVLKYYNPPSTPVVVIDNLESIPSSPFPLHHAEEEDASPDVNSSMNDSPIEVKVKKGDVLEKIARANKTTIEAIKKANHLENEKLYIGQVLKIPPSQTSLTQQATVLNTQQNFSEKKEEFNEPLYYIIKNGDNPWKIAKQYNVNYEDIVRLNHLNEEKARNLKIGDRIRVK